VLFRSRAWRGRIWAEATFKMGLCFLELDEPGKAQGFFERTYLAYRGYPHWAAEAAAASGKLLERLGEQESARRTYQSFLELPDAEQSSHYEAIRQRVEILSEPEYVEADS